MPDILLHPKKDSSDKTRAAERRFKLSMKEQGLRCTTERIAVLREVYRSGTHLNADEIFIRLKEKEVGISRATVYHTLDLLFKFHLVAKIDLGHKHTHYEKSLGVANHLHIVCAECDKVIEVTDSGLADMVETLCRQNGFELGSFSLQVFGRCIDDEGEKKCPETAE